MKKFFAAVIIFASLCVQSQAEEFNYYNNPLEINRDNKNLHISFRGAFRQLNEKNKTGDYIAFCFIVRSKQDMIIRVDESEAFDSNGTRFIERWGWRIGREETREREIIAEIPIKAECYIKIPPSESENLPLISRVNFRFNGQWYQFRNIQVQDWREWDRIKRDEGIK